MKEEAAAKSLPPIYRGKWASAPAADVAAELAAGTPHCFRFRVPPGQEVVVKDAVRGDVTFNTDAVGDFVVLRSNGLPVYNFCVAIDDALMGITHVIRAEEHLPNTLRQRLVLAALGFTPPAYGHVSLILAPDKSKLSKRHGATSVGEFREQGFLADAMINYLALLGWNDGTEQEIFTRDELFSKFSLDRITKSAAVFDVAKLRWMNGQHLRALGDGDLIPLLGSAWVESGLVREADSEFVRAAAAVVKTSLEVRRPRGGGDGVAARPHPPPNHPPTPFSLARHRRRRRAAQAPLLPPGRHTGVRRRHRHPGGRLCGRRRCHRRGSRLGRPRHRCRRCRRLQGLGQSAGQSPGAQGQAPVHAAAPRAHRAHAGAGSGRPAGRARGRERRRGRRGRARAAGRPGRGAAHVAGGAVRERGGGVGGVTVTRAGGVAARRSFVSRPPPPPYHDLLAATLYMYSPSASRIASRVMSRQKLRDVRSWRGEERGGERGAAAETSPTPPPLPSFSNRNQQPGHPLIALLDVGRRLPHLVVDGDG